MSYPESEMTAQYITPCDYLKLRLPLHFNCGTVFVYIRLSTAEQVDWGRGYGATTPSHLGLWGMGPLCTAFSSAHHLQRRSMSSNMRDLLVKDVIGREIASQFGLQFRLRHGTDNFTSPPKEGMLWIFCPKNQTASAGFEPAISGTRGQHANH
jgi:hypothetical protein